MSEASRRRAGTAAWILLVLASGGAGRGLDRYHLAAVVAFPLALAGVAEVIRVRGGRQRY